MTYTKGVSSTKETPFLLPLILRPRLPQRTAPAPWATGRRKIFAQSAT